jgi:hypothetical protein
MRFESIPLQIAESNGTPGPPQRCKNLEDMCLQIGGNMSTCSLRVQGTANDVDWAFLDIDGVSFPITDITLSCELKKDGHPYVLSQIRMFTVIYGVSAAPTATLAGRNAETYPR